LRASRRVFGVHPPGPWQGLGWLSHAWALSGKSARRENGTVLRGFRAVWALKTLWIRALGSAAIEKETCWEKASM